MAQIESHRDLIVWQKGMDLWAECHELTRLLPRAEEYRLTSQLLRAATSVPSNIAEGHSRGTRREYAHFVSIARGSLAETDTLLVGAVRVKLLTEEQARKAFSLCVELSKMLSSLLNKLR